MAYAPEDMQQDDIRARVRDQIELIRDPARDVKGGVRPVATDTKDLADHNFLFDPGVVLVNAADIPEVNRVLAEHVRELGVEQLGDPVDQVIEDLGTYRMLDASIEFEDVRRFLSVLDVLDEELGEGVVTPDHYLHASGTGAGRPCPATEPAETGRDRPWPEETDRVDADPAVTVNLTVIDTGWWTPAGDLDWLGGVEVDPDHEETFSGPPQDPDLPEYAGHGTFIAGVARCRAPRAVLHHRKFLVQGGAVRESEMIQGLESALAKIADPNVINLSAGGHTRNGFHLKSFQRLWKERLKDRPDTVLVAAAGNDGTMDPFYPAAFTWAVGVGSLDKGGRISSFSNYGNSADVSVVGRNHVNAFPTGTYICKETPDVGDVRHFSNKLARWSGTSFAAPLVAGLIAAERNVNNDRTVTQIAWDLVNGTQEQTDPLRGHYRPLLPDVVTERYR